MLPRKICLSLALCGLLISHLALAATGTALGKTSNARSLAKSHAAIPSYPEIFEIDGLTINPAFIIDLYNVAQSNNQVISTLPPAYQAFNSILNITVKNTGTVTEPLYFQLSGSYSGCTSGMFSYPANGAVIQSISPLSPGSSTIGLGGIEVYNNSFSQFNASACLQNNLSNSFSSISNINQAVQLLMTQTFNICITPWDPNANHTYGAAKCDLLQVFSQDSNNIGAAPIIILPHNSGICTNIPLFVWTQAKYQAVNPATIPYTLKVCEGSADGKVVEIVNIPAGQLYYQWSAKDPVLDPQKKYYFMVTALNSTGSPLFPNSLVWKWFTTQCATASLGGVDGLVKAYYASNSGGNNAAIASAIKGKTLKALTGPVQLNSQIVQDLISGNAKISSGKIVNP